MEQDGTHLWRQIGEALARDIERGTIPPGERLPASSDLAVRFGVNRHTVLRAIAHLQSEGVLRVERGRGTYVVGEPLSYRLDAHRRFEENLLQSNTAPMRQVVGVTELPATDEIADHLGIASGALAARVTLLGSGDGVPVNLNTSYFPVERMRGIADAFRAFGEAPTDRIIFSEVLGAFGYGAFRRRTIRLRARPPSPEEAHHLQMARVDSVLETEVTSVDPSGVPVMHAFTRFCSSRVELVIDF